MKKKILLINPPSKDMIRTNMPAFCRGATGYFPPLGLLYIAAYLLKYTKHIVEFIDAEAEELNYNEIKSRIEYIQPDIVGITSLSFTHINALKIAKIIKEMGQNILVVMGGTHPTIYPEETVKLNYVDYVIVGEGEIIFTDFIDKMKRGEKGIIRQEGYIRDLDSLPFPARHLAPLGKYRSVLARRKGLSTTIITSRGCPYKCLFCDRPNIGKKFRYRSTKNVVDEIEECVKVGIREFHIYDDTFTVIPSRVIEICDEIIKRNLDICWSARTRVDTVNKKILQKMYRAGCHHIHYGVESTNPRILNILRKNIAIDKIEEAFKNAREVGIKTLAYFMIGNPSESKEEIINNIKYAIKLKPDYAHFSILTPFPATDLYRKGIDEGIITKDYWRDFALNPNRNLVPKFWEENLSENELQELIKLAYKKFYIRPRYILNEIKNIRTFKELVKRVYIGFKVMKF